MGGFQQLGDALASAVGAIASDDGLRSVAWALAVVLTWSGVAKLRNPISAAYALVDFRVAQQVRASRGMMLAAGEIAIAVALVAGATAGAALLVVSAVAAAALFLAFVAVIARSLRAGEQFACYCFGEDSSTLSALTLLRAAALALVAVALAVEAGSLAGASSFDVALLPAVIAGSAVAIGTLLGHVRSLTTWNARPFEHDENHYVQRVGA